MVLHVWVVQVCTCTWTKPIPSGSGLGELDRHVHKDKLCKYGKVTLDISIAGRQTGRQTDRQAGKTGMSTCFIKRTCENDTGKEPIHSLA